MISVLLADDEAMVREGLRLIVDDQQDLHVVAEAHDGPSALALARELCPDVVVLDIRMPGIDGLTVARRLLADSQWPGRVIMLTTYGQDEYLYAALQAGASGFLLKTSPPRLLPIAIREAYAGETMISSELTRRLIDKFATDRGAPSTTPRKSLADLTPRELDVLRLVARGRSNTEIAANLVVAESTVKTHVLHILSKLGLRDRTQAAVTAYECGLVRPSGSRANQSPRGANGASPNLVEGQQVKSVVRQGEADQVRQSLPGQPVQEVVNPPGPSDPREDPPPGSGPRPVGR